MKYFGETRYIRGDNQVLKKVSCSCTLMVIFREYGLPLSSYVQYVQHSLWVYNIVHLSRNLVSKLS